MKVSVFTFEIDGAVSVPLRAKLLRLLIEPPAPRVIVLVRILLVFRVLV